MPKRIAAYNPYGFEGRELRPNPRTTTETVEVVSIRKDTITIIRPNGQVLEVPSYTLRVNFSAEDVLNEQSTK